MTRFLKFSSVFLLCSILVSGGLVGCSPKPSNEEMGQLEQARAAAESAERKLFELRQERIAIENELQSKQNELQSAEQETKDLK